MIRNINKSFLRVYFIMLLIAVVGIGQAMAQRTVNGQLTDAMDGYPLIGASIVIKGTTTGTVTNFDGNYMLSVNDTDTLVFSYIGYLSEEVVVGSQKAITLSLLLDASEIDEVVVVGYGVQKKVNLTGSVSVIDAKDMEKSNATNVSSALQGRAAGVSMMATSGDPGGKMNIRVRGVGSMNNEAQPLIIIDGIIATSDDLNSLNPQDVASMSVLKDAAAASIYGARSSNGVILVTTKKGKSGETKINFNAQFGVANTPKKLDLFNSDQYVDYYTRAYSAHNKRFGADAAILPPAYTNTGVSTDWIDLINNENALTQNYNISLSSGSENLRYLISATYLDEEGILETTNREQTTIRINSELKVKKWLSIGENVSFSVSDGRNPGVNNVWQLASIASPLMPVYNSKNKEGYQGPDIPITGNNDRTNVYAELMLTEDTYKKNRFFGSTYADFTILKDLKFKSTLGMNYTNTNNTHWVPRYELGRGRDNPQATLSETAIFYSMVQWDNILTYNKVFGEHNMGFLAGHTHEDHFTNQFSGGARGFDYENIRNLSAGDPTLNSSSQVFTPIRRESYFGRINYNYRDKYLFEAVVRRDASSKFAQGYNTGVFPAFSAGWKISEDFFQNVEQLDMLKLRVGWGKSGNEPDADFLYDTQLSGYDEFVYSFGASEIPTFGVGPNYSYGSPQLRWEKAIMSNIGVDVYALNNRLEFTAEYYIKAYEDLLVNVPLKMVWGLGGNASPPIDNKGDMRNQGFEFNAIWKKSEGAFNYNISANITTQKNTVLNVPEDKVVYNNTTTVVIGQTVGSYYGFVADRLLTEEDFVKNSDGTLAQRSDGSYYPLFPTQEALVGPGDIKFQDLNGDGKITDTDQTIIGKSIPDFMYGINFDCTYKNFDFAIFFQAMQNYQVYNNFYSAIDNASGDPTGKDENKLSSVNDYWTQGSGIDNQTGVGLYDYNRNNRFSSWWLEDASFIRLKSLQLGYSLPRDICSRWGIGKARAFIGGQNLLVMTKYQGYDPEVSSKSILDGSVDNGNTPIPRIWTLGFNVNF